MRRAHEHEAPGVTPPDTSRAERVLCRDCYVDRFVPDGPVDGKSFRAGESRFDEQSGHPELEYELELVVDVE